MSRKVIAVVGATGKQGGSLVRAILKDPQSNFSVRAITRHPESDKSRKLTDLGAEVVQGDINDEMSLTKAIEGCYGLYCITLSSGDDYSPELEIHQAETMAKAASNAGIQHVIWSTMEDTRLKIPLEDAIIPTLDENFKVPHYDSKGESDVFFENLPTTYLLTSFYWDNFIDMEMGPAKYLGKYFLSFPIGKSRMPGMAVEDVGKCALGIFKRPEEYIGKRVGIAGEHLTLKQMALKMTAAFGGTKKIEAYEMPLDEYRRLSFEGADDFANQFYYIATYDEEFCLARSVEESRQLNPELQDLDAWLNLHKDRFRLK